MEVESIKFEMSPTIGKLAGALAMAQSKMGSALKDSNNPFFKSKYADLASVISAIKPIHEHGLSYSQHPIGRTGMITLLMHESGEWMKSEMHMKPTKDDPQGQGSAQTYMRRYGLQAVCGIPSDDDDGNAASQTVSQPLKPLKSTSDILTDQEIMDVKKRLARLGYTREELVASIGVWPPENNQQWSEALKLSRKKSK